MNAGNQVGMAIVGPMRIHRAWALNDIGSYLINFAQWLIDVPMQLALARTANLRFEQASNAMSSFPGTIEIHGTAGWVRAEGMFDRGGTILTHAGDRHAFPEVTTAEVYAMALLDFLDGVRGLPTIGATPRQAADTIAIVEAAVRGHRPAGRGADRTGDGP
jgi:predicted dehydrogenase